MGVGKVKRPKEKKPKIKESTNRFFLSNPEADPFNLHDIIWGTGGSKQTQKRKKYADAFTLLKKDRVANKKLRAAYGAVGLGEMIDEEGFDSLDCTFDLNKEPTDEIQKEVEATLKVGKIAGIRLSRFESGINQIVQDELVPVVSS